MRAGGWVWDVPRSSHVYHPVFPHSLLSHWNIHTIAIMCRLYILCPCSHSAIWHALYTFPTLHSLPGRWTQQTLESQEKWKHSLLVKGHGLVLLQYALAKKKNRIKNFQNNQHLKQPKWFKSSNELFSDMTIYGLSHCLGRSLKERILAYQSQGDHRNDISLSHVSSDGETEAPSIIITNVVVTAFSAEDRWIIVTSIIST